MRQGQAAEVGTVAKDCCRQRLPDGVGEQREPRGVRLAAQFLGKQARAFRRPRAIGGTWQGRGIGDQVLEQATNLVSGRSAASVAGKVKVPRESVKGPEGSRPAGGLRR
jgi:hypothetical protein